MGSSSRRRLHVTLEAAGSGTGKVLWRSFARGTTASIAYLAGRYCLWCKFEKQGKKRRVRLNNQRKIASGVTSEESESKELAAAVIPKEDCAKRSGIVCKPAP